MRVEEVLASLGLGQYAQAFTDNDIDSHVLRSLSDSDLKELGVSSLGHRKKLLAWIASGQQTQPDDAADASATKERIFFDGHLGPDKIRITSHRAVLGDKTYALANIGAVEVRLSAETEAHNEAIEKKNQGLRSLKRGMAGLGVAMVFFFVLSLSQALSRAPFDPGAPPIPEGEAATILLALIAVALFVVAALMRRLPLRPPSWSLYIMSGGVPADTLTSTDKSHIERIVSALNDAIADLNV